MTLENCERLLAHYEEIGNEEAAAEMRIHIERKGGKVEETKSKKKK